MISQHSHTRGSAIAFTLRPAGFEQCAVCVEEDQIERLIRAVRQRSSNPYDSHYMNLRRFVELAEGTNGPKPWHKARNSPARAAYELIKDHHFRASASRHQNWQLGVQAWGDCDYGIFSVDVGPFSVRLYMRWGLTEDQREERWMREIEVACQ